MYKNVIDFENYKMTKDGLFLNKYGKQLKPYDDGSETLTITLSKNGKTYKKMVSILISQNFPEPDIDGEIWKKINGFTSYKISNYKRIKNEHGKLLKIYKKYNDTEVISLSCDGKESIKSLKNLMYENFPELEDDEEWKIIKNYPNYSGSYLGKIKNNKTNYILKPLKDKNGYTSVQLYNNGKRLKNWYTDLLQKHLLKIQTKNQKLII